MFEERLASYRLLPVRTRVAGVCLTVLLITSFYYYDAVSEIVLEQSNAASKEDELSRKFEKSRKDALKLPELESIYGKVQEELIKARKRLPETFRMDDLLQMTASVAQSTGVDLSQFTPEAPVPIVRHVAYFELPIKLEAKGRYHQLGNFFDRLVHLETLVHLRHIKVTPLASDKDGILVGNAQLVVFREMTVSEAHDFSMLEEEKKAKKTPAGGNKKDKPATTEHEKSAG